MEIDKGEAAVRVALRLADRQLALDAGLPHRARSNPTRDDFRLRNQVNKTFADRRNDAADAKKKLLEKFKAAPAPDDPEMVAKRAEREAVAAAREERRAERERLKREEQTRKEAEAAAAAEAAYRGENAERIAREAEEQVRVERAVADVSAMKKKRDERYAARKARQR